MSYKDGIANETGALGEKEVDLFFKSNGLFYQKPSGQDIGIDRIVKLNEHSKKEAKIQIKGRRQLTNPRWFQLTVTRKKLYTSLSNNTDLNELWKEKIIMVDFWVLVSIPKSELWIFPSIVIYDIAAFNSRFYKKRRDNDFSQVHYDKWGKIEKKQKELNLDIMDEEGIPLHIKYKDYKENISIIIEYLNE